MRPSWNMAHHLQQQQQLQTQRQVATYTVLQLDKATQTEGSYVDDAVNMGADYYLAKAEAGDSGHELRVGKVMRERLHGLRGSGGSVEHSVSSQTLSPVHGNGLTFDNFDKNKL